MVGLIRVWKRRLMRRLLLLRRCRDRLWQVLMLSRLELLNATVLIRLVKVDTLSVWLLTCMLTLLTLVTLLRMKKISSRTA